MELSVKELQDKNTPELEKLLSEARKELRGLELQAASQELKDVRSIRSQKRTIARLMTRLTESRKQATV